MELFFLLLLFFIASLVQQAAQKQKRGGGRRPPRVRQRPARRLPPEAAPPAEQPQSIRDLFAEVRRAMEEAERRARGELEPPPPAPPEEEGFEEEAFEERGSLEEEPEVRSMEVEVRRPERAVVDLDSQAERVIRERRRWAEQRERTRTAAEHRAFDERIREPAAAPAAAPDRGAELRRLFVWREILDKPLALRE